jgi:hypothetical protein
MIDEKLSDIAGRTAEQILSLIVEEAYESLGEPIERYSLKHQTREKPKDCLTSMARDAEGGWVPWGHHQAFVVALNDAVSRARAMCSALLDLPLRESSVAIEDALNDARAFLRRVRDRGLAGAEALEQARDNAAKRIAGLEDALARNPHA